MLTVLSVGLQGPADLTARAAWGLLTALVPSLLMNICIVGINQIYDVAIDKARSVSRTPDRQEMFCCRPEHVFHAPYCL